MASLLIASLLWLAPAIAPGQELQLDIRRITAGPKHHFFGYIGHVQNIPWNKSGRYIVALRVGFKDHLPAPEEAADIVLIDTENDYAVRKIDETRAWNPQQGTMLYWNPEAQETQFFFNDRDPESNKVFCVLYDVSAGKRVREYRYEDTPFGNSGVAQKGGFFAGINYARLARLRPVTGYPQTYDWTAGENHPDDDGVFLVNVNSGEKRLLVSFRRMRDLLKRDRADIDRIPLFINHTLWNRENDRIFFFVRGNFANRESRVNTPMTVRPDGSGLTIQRVFIGGHPEWASGSRMIGRVGDDLVLYDTDAQEIVDRIGTPEIFPDPEGDTALSPDGKWIVNGWEQDEVNRYVVYRLSDGAWVHSPGFDVKGYSSGPLRIDAAPRWNRDSTQILFPAFADDAERTRQLYLITVRR